MRLIRAFITRLLWRLPKGEAAIDVPKGTLIAGYWPIRSEIDPRPLLSAFRAKGARLCLPVVLDKETIAFREYLPDTELVQTGFGTMGPGRTRRLWIRRSC